MDSNTSHQGCSTLLHEPVWFILFWPGKRDGICGQSPDINYPVADEVPDHEEVSDDGEVFDDEEVSDGKEQDRRIRMITKETEVAQQFDKLTQDGPRWVTLHMVNLIKRMCGWDAWMLERTLEDAQYVDAIAKKLAPSHPAFVAMISNVMSSIRRR